MKKQHPAKETKKILMISSPEVPKHYSNFAAVKMSEHETTLVFFDIDDDYKLPESEDIDRDGTVVAKPIVKVVIPRTMLPSLIDALNRQISTSED